MNKSKVKKFLKRYDKFKNNNMPTPFWDDERQILEYVRYDSELDYLNKSLKDIGFDKRLHVDNNIVIALGNLANASFYYPYTCGYITYVNENSKIDDFKVTVSQNHAHYFDEVVRDLYNFPESFTILKEEECYYSAQQLNYLRRVQKYLLFLGVKDLDSRKPGVKRYRNAKQRKYGTANVLSYEDKTIEDFLSGKRNFIVIIPHDIEIYDDYEDYSNQNRKELIADKEDNIKMFIEYTHGEIKQYSDIKMFYTNNSLKDSDKIFIMFFKTLEIF